ncbi:LytR cell envelope-related transcriptional attenuator [Klenkia soli]|uniref:LytR cell envelope-related transcriptional attenuator n=1 Tax=Klenkia soli TaxID=1052260 RepID=A0A1H0JMS2_9ACTN|nr:LytR cell envelope-related transcriptional attenuator [Klenkia soli]
MPPPAEQAPAAGGEGPRTSVDPLPGSRPPAARAPETSSLPAWATSLGPPTPPPGTETARETAPEPAPWTGPERRSADRPEGVPATGDRRGARTHSVPERPPLPSLPPPGPAAAPAPGPTAGPGTSPGAAAPAGRRSPERSTEPGSGETGVIGGRAASRAERQAVDVVRRREERRQGITPIPPLPDEGRRGSRGLVLGLVAAVVIALVLLGVWSFQRPGTEESASSAPATTSSAAPASSSQAPATSAPAPTSAVPTGPVFAPVTVLNATTVNGLAGAIGAALSAGGWEIRGEDSYTTGDVAVTTVFYTAGDVQQQAAAATLQAQFPDILGGPSERFFDVAGEPDPGIVVVATGNWQP